MELVLMSLLGNTTELDFFALPMRDLKVIKLPYQQTEVPYRADCSLSNKFVAPPR